MFFQMPLTKSGARQAKIMIVVKANDTLALDTPPAPGKKCLIEFKMQFSLTKKICFNRNTLFCLFELSSDRINPETSFSN